MKPIKPNKEKARSITNEDQIQSNDTYDAYQSKVPKLPDINRPSVDEKIDLSKPPLYEAFKHEINAINIDSEDPVHVALPAPTAQTH